MTRLISTHALREEGDWHDLADAALCIQFLPTPSARRATWVHDLDKREGQFLPTPSARRATSWSIGHTACKGYFYPRPPRGGRRPLRALRNRVYFISTHALREEGDFGKAGNLPQKRDFYPRPPRGGRPRHRRHVRHHGHISTHALREEGDAVL